jgi:ferredoxin-NADP reductase
MVNPKFEVRLVQTREIAPEVRHFCFEVPGVETFHFEPGQFVSFEANLNGNHITRAYSIASPPGGNWFELCLNRVREGHFSPHLFELKPGDQVTMHGPYGAFVFRQPATDAVLVATGTGIAPFRSMLRARLLYDIRSRLKLLFGVRHEYGILYRSEFEELAMKHPNFKFWPTLSRPADAWTGRSGHVQAHLEEALEGRTDVQVYICGLKVMVDDVRRILKAKGFDRRCIIYEKYD